MGNGPTNPPPKAAPSNGGASPPTPTPGAAAASTAATAGAAKGLGAGLASWWQSLVKDAKPVKGSIEKAAKELKKNAQNLKLAMPVDVKVDFLRPTVEAVRDSVQSVWKQLPPPVQQAAPFVGVAVGSSLVVFAVQQHRLQQQRKKTEDVRVELHSLLKERALLLRQINDLQTRPRTDVEVRLSAAVATATNAAAAAAEAAARAAGACMIPRQPGSLPPAEVPGGMPPAAE